VTVLFSQSFSTTSSAFDFRVVYKKYIAANYISSADTEHSQVWTNHYSHAWYASLVTCAPAHHVRDL